MTSGLQNSALFLQTSRHFPKDLQSLQVELDKSYIDIANNVNARTLGTFGPSKPLVTGESWFMNGEANKKQTLRQVYRLTATGNVPHGLNLSQIGGFTRIYGQFTDGTIWYPLPYVDVTNVNNQISIKVTGSNIVITPGAGSPPSLTSGFMILEWLSS